MHAYSLLWYIVEAFKKLEGPAHYKIVAQKVRQLGYKGGGEDLGKHVRKRIYEHSSDTPDQFIGNPGSPSDDLFCTPNPGSGIWALRDSMLGTAAQQAPTEVDVAYPEGRELFRLHRRRERSPRAVQRKKQTVFADHGKLLCEVCDFDFASVYGDLGSGFAECHHRVPLGELKAEHRTLLSDLAIVCANCHRMLHRGDGYTVKGLRKIVLTRRGQA